MPLTKYTASTAIIAALADLPNATSGLTAAQLKAKFDESPTAFKAFVNTLIDEIEAQYTANEQVLTLTNTTAFTPTAQYHPSTKGYVDDTVAGVVLGEIPDNSLTEAKLAFPIATQAELDAVSIGSNMYAYKNLGGF